MITFVCQVNQKGQNDRKSKSIDISHVDDVSVSPEEVRPHQDDDDATTHSVEGTPHEEEEGALRDPVNNANVTSSSSPPLSSPLVALFSKNDDVIRQELGTSKHRETEEGEEAVHPSPQDLLTSGIYLCSLVLMAS